MYFGYSRQSGDAYIRFLLSKFSSKGIFEKNLLLNTENEITEPMLQARLPDTDTIEEEADPEIVSKLKAERDRGGLKPERIG